jgi:hypothetical protein
MHFIEVFRTNVVTAQQASFLVGLIHDIFPHYTATFDLDDCDKILRIKADRIIIEAQAIISVLKNAGVLAEILPDEIPPYIGDEVLLSTH